jgi:hypothetical protein
LNLKKKLAMIFRWLRRRAVSAVLVRADAIALIERFGENAMSEACLREQEEQRVIDSSRPDGHWRRVKDEIRRRQSER